MLACIFPYSIEKNLGKVYNETISKFDDDDWIIIKDYDVLFLLPETIKQIKEYTERYPDAGVFTCFTNRISNTDQLLNSRVNADSDILNHIKLATKQQDKLYQVTELKGAISGMVVVIKKSTWNNIKFNEDLSCLGVDNDFCNKVMASGLKILRMDGIYVWHTYRIINGIKNKGHLL